MNVADQLSRDRRYRLREARTSLVDGVRHWDAASRPGDEHSFPGVVRDGECRHALQPYFAEREPEGKRGELDCSRPLCLQCMICGHIEWRKCRATRPSSCVPCSRRYMTSKRYQLRDALTAFAFHGYCVSWLTLTFPGFGGCQPWCLCHEVRGRDGMTVGEWNGQLTKRFHDAKQWLERHVGFRIEHHRAVEPQLGQRRCEGAGTQALHAHVWLVSSRPIVLTKSEWRRFAAKFGFGHEYHFEAWSFDGVGAVPDEFLERVGYSTGYLKSKVTDDLRSVPYVHPNPERRTGEDVCRVRAFTNSRGFCDSVSVMARRWVLLQRHRQALQARYKVLMEAAVEAEAMPASVGRQPGADGGAGAAGALESLLDELHRWEIPVLPNHRCGVAV